MMKVPILLIHPPVAKPSEPPAGVARLAGALRARQVACKVIDANIEGMTYLLNHSMPAEDTWSRRAYRHRDLHLAALRRPDTYTCSDAYRRAVADVNRLLAGTGASDGIRVGLADYRDSALSPVRSADLRYAARHPEKNPFHAYYRNVLLPRIFRNEPAWVGLSINFLSQALCAFALIGLLKQTCPNIKLIAGGGLITSWMQRPGFADAFSNLVDHMAAGPGEAALLKRLGCRPAGAPCLPDYRDLMPQRYLSPGFILPFSASAGCWWRRCAFCPEQAERQPFRPLPHTEAVRQLGRLCRQTAPVLIHLLDNAVSPALLKALTANPPGAPWYGFVRIGAPLDDAAFCKRLAAAGCAMLQIGLESGHQPVLDRLNKGVRLETAHRVLDNLRRAGIRTYVYVLFGTPVEDEAAARDTLNYVADHRASIDFLNVAIFNLPVGSLQAGGMALHDFYAGDLALYRDFEHPLGWGRRRVRHFVERVFKKHPAVQPIVRRDPPIFTANHAAFMQDSLNTVRFAP